MFGISGFELFIIIVFIFVIFGPDKLPEIIKYAGLIVKKFRNAKAEVDKVVNDEVVQPIMDEANKPDPAPKAAEVTAADANEKIDAAAKKKEAAKKAAEGKKQQNVPKKSQSKGASKTKKSTQNKSKSTGTQKTQKPGNTRKAPSKSAGNSQVKAKKSEAKA